VPYHAELLHSTLHGTAKAVPYGAELSLHSTLHGTAKAVPYGAELR